MIHVRPVTPDRLREFASALTPADRIPDVLTYASRLIAKGAMRPEWCFVANEGRAVVGRCAFWALPTSGRPRDLVLFDVPFGSADAERVGNALLGAMIRMARSAGCTSLGHVVDSPSQAPQWQEAPEARRALLEHHGFVVVRETLRFELTPDGPLAHVAEPAGLRYRSYADTGEAAFVAAIEAVSQGTLDREIRARSEEAGAKAAARELLADLRAMEFEPSWWELALTPEDTLVGLVMPTLAPAFATIGYIGVVPAMRGRGLVRALLARGTDTLRRASVPLVRADTDRANAPMAAGFRALGYRQFATRTEFLARLAA